MIPRRISGASARHCFAVGPTLDFRRQRRLIWVVDAGKARNLSGSGFAIEPFHISLLASSERRIHIDLKEICNARAHFIPTLSIRRDRGNNRNNTVTAQHLCDKSDASNIFVPILPAEAEPAGQMLTDLISVERFDAVTASPKAFIDCSAEGGLARRTKTG